MKRFAFLLIFSSSLFSEPYVKRVFYDFVNYYSWYTFNTMVEGIIPAGVMANTPLDQSIQDYYQDNIRSQGTDDFFHFWKLMGQDQALYLYSGLAGFTFVFQWTDIGQEAATLLLRSGRAFLVGTPPLHIMREFIGGARPSNTTRSSRWIFFTLPHGVSGHTYTGAIIWITAAKMVDNIFLKSILYATSTLTGLSRINDNDHYPSQVLLGWLMAYVACQAVYKTDSSYNLTLQPDRVSFSLDF